jgi:hypothetical protein
VLKNPICILFALGAIALAGPSYSKPPELPQRLLRAAATGGLKVTWAIPLKSGKGPRLWAGSCREKKRLSVCVFSEKNGDFSYRQGSARLNGAKVTKLYLRELTPQLPGPEVLYELTSENPDEKIQRLHAFTVHDKPREIFATAIFRPKDPSKREAWEQAKDVIAYGDPSPKWYFKSKNPGASKEATPDYNIAVRSTPQVLTVPRANRKPALLITGIRESIYSYQGDPQSGQFVKIANEQFVEFLPRQEPSSVTASAAHIPKAIKDKIESERLNFALSALDEQEDTSKNAEEEFDMSPFIIVGSDGDTNTAWIEDDDGPGFGEWLELTFDEPVKLNMLRVVPGCTDTQKNYKTHNIPTKIEVRFSNSTRAYINLTRPEYPSTPIVAHMVAPLNNRFATQSLIFFEGTENIKSARLILSEVKKENRTNRTCISEFSIH